MHLSGLAVTAYRSWCCYDEKRCLPQLAHTGVPIGRWLNVRLALLVVREALQGERQGHASSQQ